jgi:transketolase
MRACEQMRTFVAYPHLNVKFVGVNGGLLGGEREGVTHQFYEDLGVVGMLPSFTVFTPADPAQCYWAVRRAAEITGPVYIRAGSGRESVVYEQNAPFSKDGFTIWQEDGTDVLVLSSGFVLDRVIEAGKKLKTDGCKVTVADVNIIWDKNPEALLSLLATFTKIVTVEDHNVNGGLGAYICTLVCEHKGALVHRIGLRSFGESGPAKELADHYGFDADSIASAVKNL